MVYVIAQWNIEWLCRVLLMKGLFYDGQEEGQEETKLDKLISVATTMNQPTNFSIKSNPSQTSDYCLLRVN